MIASTLMVGPSGRLTLPKELLHGLGLKAGDKLQFSVHADGAVFICTLPRADDPTSPPPKRSGPRAGKHD